MRRGIFFAILLLTIPIWLVMLVLIIDWGIAKNFANQINAGYNRLIDEDGNMKDVVGIDHPYENVIEKPQ